MKVNYESDFIIMKDENLFFILNIWNMFEKNHILLCILLSYLFQKLKTSIVYLVSSQLESYYYLRK